MKLNAQTCLLIATALITTNQTLAASFEGTLQSLVNSFIGRILPILALGYLGKNIFGHIQNDPNAGRETARIAVALVSLLGINSVWTWLQSQVR